MVIADLAQRDTAAAVAVDGSKLLQKMLDMCDRWDRLNSRESEQLIPAIATVFGGEQTTRNYLRHNVGYVLNPEQSVETQVEVPWRVEGRKHEHLPVPSHGNSSTAVSWHEDVGPSQPSSYEDLYPHAHFSTASEYTGQSDLATSNHQINDQEEPTFPHSQWSDDAALLSELFDYSQWDVLPQQLLMVPRELS
jgi:hypothetical protein